jgi:hypothetical protein
MDGKSVSSSTTALAMVAVDVFMFVRLRVALEIMQQRTMLGLHSLQVQSDKCHQFNMYRHR